MTLLFLDVAVEPLSQAGVTELPSWLLFVLVWGVEIIALRALKWGSWGRCAVDALLANIVSYAVGLGFTLYGIGFPGVAGLLVMGLLSVLIEGVVLWALRRSEQPTQAIWLTALGINAVSYALLFLLVMVL